MVNVRTWQENVAMSPIHESLGSIMNRDIPNMLTCNSWFSINPRLIYKIATFRNTATRCYSRETVVFVAVNEYFRRNGTPPQDTKLLPSPEINASFAFVNYQFRIVKFFWEATKTALQRKSKVSCIWSLFIVPIIIPGSGGKLLMAGVED